MEYNSFGGYYSPSLYKISLNTDQSLHHINQLPADIFSTLFHEYFHYLQDLTTVFGISQSWNFYNRIRQMIAYVQQSSQDEINLPLLHHNDIKELVDYFEIQKEIAGDWNINIQSKPLNEIEIIEIGFNPLPSTFKYEPGINYPFLLIRSNESKENLIYNFGAIAIIESMTTLIQEKFFGKKDFAELPYRAVNKVVDFRFPNQVHSSEAIFSLCDVSLLSPYPSIALFEILDLFKEFPTDGEIIYDIGMQYIHTKWPLWDYYKLQLSGLNGTVSELYGSDFFKYDIQWFAFVLAKGFELRDSDNMFMLRLFRESNAFDNKVMNKIKYELGAPEIMNFYNERWFSPPVALLDIQDNINTLFLAVYKKLHDFLLFGSINDNIHGEDKRHCMLKNHCLGSNRKMPVNDDCINAPWKKAFEEERCAFGIVYYLNGLTQKKFNFS